MLISFATAVCFSPVAEVKHVNPINLASQIHDRISARVERCCEGLSEAQSCLVKKYSAEYGVDFKIILALIKQESQFDEDAVSESGARGLMQIMPVTNDEINEQLGNSEVPGENLEAGIYYFSKLYDLYKGAAADDRLSLALASYNAGPARIYDAQELAAYMGENPNAWPSIKQALPLLSRRYNSLHRCVWEGGRPRNGNFGSSRQTIEYVQRVMSTYETLRSAM